MPREELTEELDQSSGEDDRWCKECDRAVRSTDYPYKTIAMGSQNIGPFCSRKCAWGWVIKNDDRPLNYLDFEPTGTEVPASVE